MLLRGAFVPLKTERDMICTLLSTLCLDDTSAVHINMHADEFGMEVIVFHRDHANRSTLVVTLGGRTLTTLFSR